MPQGAVTVARYNAEKPPIATRGKSSEEQTLETVGMGCTNRRFVLATVRFDADSR